MEILSWIVWHRNIGPVLLDGSGQTTSIRTMPCYFPVDTMNILALRQKCKLSGTCQIRLDSYYNILIQRVHILSSSKTVQLLEKNKKTLD